MKLAELFHRPQAMSGKSVNNQNVMFDNGDIVNTKADGPGQVISAPDSKGSYKVKLKSGQVKLIHHDEIELQ